jgi:type IV pilus assembly protein PilM
LSKKDIISIDVGTSRIKIVAGRCSNNHVNIKKAIAIDTPQGCVEDGKLMFNDGKADILKQSIVQALSENRIRYKNVIFTIQSTSIIRREVNVPKVKPNEMESMIRYEIEQYLPIDLDEYIIEYKTIEENGEDKSRILIAALPKAIAEDYMSIVKLLQLEPNSLDINSNAISKLFSMKQQINDAAYNLDNTVACVDLGCSHINICIISKGLYQFSRIIQAGGRDLTASIAETFKISLQDAENMKLAEANLSKFDSGEDSDMLNETISNIVFRWADEIQKVFQFYKTRNANNHIDEIYLYGGTSNLRGITDYLSRAVNMPVKQIKTLSSLKLSNHTGAVDLENYLNSIGAINRK